MQKMSKTPKASVVRIPEFRAVASGYQKMGKLFMDGGFFQQVKPTKLPLKNIIYDGADFLLRICDDEKFNWIWSIQDEVNEKDVAPYTIMEFEGGLYAVAPSIDDDMESIDSVRTEIKLWIETSGFIVDESRGYQQMTQMTYCLDEIKKGLGYEQLQVYIPIKLK